MPLLAGECESQKKTESASPTVRVKLCDDDRRAAKTKWACGVGTARSPVHPINCKYVVIAADGAVACILLQIQSSSAIFNLH